MNSLEVRKTMIAEEFRRTCIPVVVKCTICYFNPYYPLKLIDKLLE